MSTSDTSPARLNIAVVAETEPGERRVALVPEVAARLVAAGHHVLVETAAGAAAWFPDQAYRTAGAEVITPDQVPDADIVLCLRPVPPERLRAGQCLIGLLQPLF